MDKKLIYDYIESKHADLTALSDTIWGCPETAFSEYKSVAALCDELRKEGFEVAEGVGNIPTAFSARFGSGKPVIGLLGEFDALSGLSQVSDCAVKEPIVAGEAGHGCGHHLLGVASIAAAIGVKKYLEESGASGTVIYYGCPGEEGGSGKAFMARDGVFDELDLALTWHPSDVNAVGTGSSLANIQVSYKYYGVAAHAAGCPHLGRSALDAVELLNIGVQFLREHMLPEARIHYAITNTGGYSPNVVQPVAEVLYLIRAPKNPQVVELFERVNRIAQGAALMTDCKLESTFIKACSNLVPNNVLEQVLQKNLEAAPKPIYSEEDYAFAEKIRGSIENMSETVDMLAARGGKEAAALLKPFRGKALLEFVAPYTPSETPMPGSTDVGDVSWVCPTAQINTVCYAASTPGHSWQLVAQGKRPVAHMGMLYAGKAMAGAAIDLLGDPAAVEAAKAELNERLDGGKYECPIPKDVRPKAIGTKM